MSRIKTFPRAYTYVKGINCFIPHTPRQRDTNAGSTLSHTLDSIKRTTKDMPTIYYTKFTCSRTICGQIIMYSIHMYVHMMWCRGNSLDRLRRKGKDGSLPTSTMVPRVISCLAHDIRHSAICLGSQQELRLSVWHGIHVHVHVCAQAT